MPKGLPKNRPAKVKTSPTIEASPKVQPAPKSTPSRESSRSTLAERWVWLAPAILLVVTLACYWIPMTSSDTTIVWDAADYHRPVQNYLSQELHAGRIPFWTPYPWAGYPFLADPQVGAWYPLNWPFFLLGIGLRTLVVEHWLTALEACLGAYFLACRLLRHRPAAVIAGLCYGVSGFWVGNAAHTGVLQTAACMPWMLLLLDCALESHALRYTIAGGLVAGMAILAGHFQTALYSFLALGLFACARALELPWASRTLKSRARVCGLALAVPVIGTLLSAIATAPGLELTANSVRTALTALSRTEGELPLRALLTMVYPNYLGGVVSGKYTGPFDITQYYYYAGFLMVPLAIAGWANRGLRKVALWLMIVPIWYAMGRYAGLFLLIARLPGFSSVRAPVNVWFVASLGVALLAAAGFQKISTRWNVTWLAPVVFVFLGVDLFYFQSAVNQLPYGRVSYQQAYGMKEDVFRTLANSGLPPLTRIEEPEMTMAFGPLSHFLDVRAEVTNGYGPLRLSRYADYIAALDSNGTLRNGLGVSVRLDRKTKLLQANPDFLPRATFPAELLPVRSIEESKRWLLVLDQRRQALVPPEVTGRAQDGRGVAEVREFTPGHYRIHYRCSFPSVMRVSNAYFPGWAAQVDGQPIDVFPVDHALIGVVVPAGERDLELDYHSSYFLPGALVSLITLLACVGILLWPLLVKTGKAAAAT